MFVFKLVMLDFFDDDIVEIFGMSVSVVCNNEIKGFIVIGERLCLGL